MTEIKHPSYYVQNAPTLEPMDLTMRLPHPLASAFEYVYRAGSKPGVPALDDLRKAEFWLEAAFDRMDAGLMFPRPHVPELMMLLHLFEKKCELAGVLLLALQPPMLGGKRDAAEIWYTLFDEALCYVRYRINEEEEKAAGARDTRHGC